MTGTATPSFAATQTEIDMPQPLNTIGLPPIPPEDQLAKMPWEQLISLRQAYKTRPDVQELLAQYEHRAYAREEVAKNPLMAPVYGAMVPGYAGYKALGKLTGARGPNETGGTLGQMANGFAGVGEGLSQWWNQPKPTSGI